MAMGKNNYIEATEEGYLDENGKKLTKEQLDFRIFLSQQRVKELEKENEKLKSLKPSDQILYENRAISIKHNKLLAKYEKLKKEQVSIEEIKSKIHGIEERDVYDLKFGALRLVNFLSLKYSNRDCKKALSLFLNCSEDSVGVSAQAFLKKFSV